MTQHMPFGIPRNFDGYKPSYSNLSNFSIWESPASQNHQDNSPADYTLMTLTAAMQRNAVYESVAIIVRCDVQCDATSDNNSSITLKVDGVAQASYEPTYNATTSWFGAAWFVPLTQNNVSHALVIRLDSYNNSNRISYRNPSVDVVARVM